MSSDPSEPIPNPKKKRLRSLRRFAARDSRENLWAFLDLLDARPALKKGLVIGVPLLVIATALAFWGYGRWSRTNSIRIARQWLEADRLDQAGAAIQEAIAEEPDRPDPWRLASELAWKKGKKSSAVDYAKKAAAVGRYDADDVLAWGEASVLSGDVAQAVEAEHFLDPATSAQSARALRLAGEVARQGRRYEEARDRFQAALQADTKAGAATLAMDEVPLGVVSLQTSKADDRSKGQALLSKWAADERWGAEALRALLADALAHAERRGAVRLAESLRAHPRCTLGDIPTCLKALAESDTEHYRAMLDPLEAKSRMDATQSAQLLGWLVQIGQGEEAVRWGQSLDPAQLRKPPVAPGLAEALRVTERWSQLQDLVDNGDWGREFDFMGLAYSFVAARHLSEPTRADSLWQSLVTDGRLNAAHALFAGDSLYAWGYPSEASTLLWAAADRPDLAFQALGSLLRLYQVHQDASGQCKAFGRLNAMRPGDRDIANNYAYYAALTDEGGQSRIERIAEDNFAHEPSNVYYRSTYAFVLVWTGQTSKALTILGPVAQSWKTSPVVAFSYGAALASAGRKPEAAEVFDSIKSRDLEPREIEWIKAALR